MTKVFAIRFCTILIAAFASGCGPRPILDRDFPDAYWRSGDYVLIAIDAEAQMSLSIDDKHEWGITHSVVDATVFAVGADDRYIIAKQHPVSADQVHFDRSVTNYFIVDRLLTATLPDRRKGVIGPLTREQFEQKAAALQLPNFTKTFPTLEWQRTD